VCACARARAHARVGLHIMSNLPAAAVTYVLGCVFTPGTQSEISLTACCEILTLTKPSCMPSSAEFSMVHSLPQSQKHCAALVALVAFSVDKLINLSCVCVVQHKFQFSH